VSRQLARLLQNTIELKYPDHTQILNQYNVHTNQTNASVLSLVGEAVPG